MERLSHILDSMDDFGFSSGSQGLGMAYFVNFL